jgi:hypothetical protein
MTGNVRFTVYKYKLQRAIFVLFFFFLGPLGSSQMRSQIMQEGQGRKGRAKTERADKRGYDARLRIGNLVVDLGLFFCF